MRSSLASAGLGVVSGGPPTGNRTQDNEVSDRSRGGGSAGDSPTEVEASAAVAQALRTVLGGLAESCFARNIDCITIASLRAGDTPADGRGLEEFALHCSAREQHRIDVEESALREFGDLLLGKAKVPGLAPHAGIGRPWEGSVVPAAEVQEAVDAVGKSLILATAGALASAERAEPRRGFLAGKPSPRQRGDGGGPSHDKTTLVRLSAALRAIPDVSGRSSAFDGVVSHLATQRGAFAAQFDVLREPMSYEERLRHNAISAEMCREGGMAAGIAQRAAARAPAASLAGESLHAGSSRQTWLGSEHIPTAATLARDAVPHPVDSLDRGMSLRRPDDVGEPPSSVSRPDETMARAHVAAAVSRSASRTTKATSRAAAPGPRPRAMAARATQHSSAPAPLSLMAAAAMSLQCSASPSPTGSFVNEGQLFFAPRSSRATARASARMPQPAPSPALSVGLWTVTSPSPGPASSPVSSTPEPRAAAAAFAPTASRSMHPMPSPGSGVEAQHDAPAADMQDTDPSPAKRVGARQGYHIMVRPRDRLDPEVRLAGVRVRKFNPHASALRRWRRTGHAEASSAQATRRARLDDRGVVPSRPAHRTSKPHDVPPVAARPLLSPGSASFGGWTQPSSAASQPAAAFNGVAVGSEAHFSADETAMALLHAPTQYSELVGALLDPSPDAASTTHAISAAGDGLRRRLAADSALRHNEAARVIQRALCYSFQRRVSTAASSWLLSSARQTVAAFMIQGWLRRRASLRLSLKTASPEFRAWILCNSETLSHATEVVQRYARRLAAMRAGRRAEQRKRAAFRRERALLRARHAARRSYRADAVTGGFSAAAGAVGHQLRLSREMDAATATSSRRFAAWAMTRLEQAKAARLDPTKWIELVEKTSYDDERVVAWKEALERVKTGRAAQELVTLDQMPKLTVRIIERTPHVVSFLSMASGRTYRVHPRLYDAQDVVQAEQARNLQALEQKLLELRTERATASQRVADLAAMARADALASRVPPPSLRTPDVWPVSGSTVYDRHEQRRGATGKAVQRRHGSGRTAFGSAVPRLLWSAGARRSRPRELMGEARSRLAAVLALALS